jgi:hypothetical protein
MSLNGITRVEDYLSARNIKAAIIEGLMDHLLTFTLDGNMVLPVLDLHIHLTNIKETSMPSISAKEFSGPQDSKYVGFWAGNISEPTDVANETLMRRAFRFIEKDEPKLARGSAGTSPTYLLGVDVPEGAQFLSYAAWDDVKNTFPQGIQVKVTKPDGQPLVLSGENLTADDVIWSTAPDGSPSTFSFLTPAAGPWTFEISVSEDADEFQMFASTLPLTDDVNTMEKVMSETFPELAGPEVAEELGKGAVGESWRCWGCKIGFWVLAVIIVVAVIALLIVTLGPESVIVVWLVSASGQATAAVLTFLRMAFAGITTITVGSVTNQICTWIGVCPN